MPAAMKGFDRFVGIDWSGARGSHMRGLAVAVAQIGHPDIRIVTPETEGLTDHKLWSRPLIRDWLKTLAQHPTERTLVGIDAAFSLPFVDAACFLPGSDDRFEATDAHSLWGYIDGLAQEDETLYARAFPVRCADHFLMTGHRGRLFSPRLRVSEAKSNVDTRSHGRMESAFHLIGPSQVGLGAFSAMRMLAGLREQSGVRVWPFDGDMEVGTLWCVEVFATLFARLGGATGKIRTKEALSAALCSLGGKVAGTIADIDDHQADAVITAAGLRHMAEDNRYWNPTGLTDKVRETEGWVFGVL